MLKLSVPSFQTRKYWKNMLSVVEKIETKVHGVHRDTDSTDILRVTAFSFLPHSSVPVPICLNIIIAIAIQKYMYLSNKATLFDKKLLQH